MPRIAFIMKLHAGKEGEYRRRHDAIWPELSALLKDTGIREYSIFLEERTGQLFGYMKIDDPVKLDQLPVQPVMQRWWEFMKDLMDTNPDSSPVSIPLKEVFYLP
jgi:L-rhamnose mutarotase